MHLINSETGAVYPPLPDDDQHLPIWAALTRMIDKGQVVFNPETGKAMLVAIIN